MSTLYIIALTVVGPVCLFFIIRTACIMLKRSSRKMELRRHIYMILDSTGCEDAFRHYGAAEHIVRFYGIGLSEADYPGTLADLRENCKRSRLAAERRKEQAAIELAMFDAPSAA